MGMILTDEQQAILDGAMSLPIKKRAIVSGPT